MLRALAAVLLTVTATPAVIAQPAAAVTTAKPNNDKCLAIKNNASGWNQPIVNATCSVDRVRNDEWTATWSLISATCSGTPHAATR